MESEPIRILLVDDLVLFRQSLRCLLERSPRLIVVGEAGDGFEAASLAETLMPDVILMDILMPKCDGLAAVKQMQLSLPGVRVIMLTVSEDGEDLFEAVRAGARGYLLKSADADAVVRAVECVAQGGAVVSPQMAAKLLNEFVAFPVTSPATADAGDATLTPREKEILQLVKRGLSNKEIGVALVITEGTVKRHLRNVMEKLHIHNRTQAATYALRGDLVKGCK